MSLPEGTRLGPYEVAAKLGEGGMGEVYRATDTTLDRAVAIKVLPESFALDADRVARFTREAKTLAALNHPNIAQVFGVEQQGDMRALVMELVEGEDLSQIIARGPIAWADALPIARQIAEALEAAHEQGIVHRDLKPANIKVRADGTVKVLDFGLAKAMGPDSGPGTLDSSGLTLTSPAMTAMGMIIGTAAYMAPEQAKGRPVDKRADIWAFGVVLHEMLTGRRLFDAEDVSETLAAVLTRDTGLVAMPADIPPRLRALVRDCLVRDPRQRLRDIGEARRMLDRIIAGEPDGAAAAGAALPGRRDRLPWMLAGISALAAVVAVTAVWWPRGSAEPPRRIQFTVPTEAFVATAFSVDRPRVSPDGRMIAFVSPSADGGASVIWIRSLDAASAREIPGSSGARGLFWSPDSRSIGYGTGDKVYRVGASAEGEAPQLLCDLPDFVSAVWMRSGSILLNTASNTAGMRLFQVSEQGGPPVELTLAGAEGPASAPLWPSLLPDGRHLIYFGWSLNYDERALYVASLDGGTPVRLLQADAMADYVEPGFLVYLRAGTLFAHRFDPKGLTLIGEPVRLAEDVATNRLMGVGAFSASDNGTLVYRTSGGASELSELVWVDRRGTVTGTVGDARQYYQIRLSPDDRRVAISVGDPGTSVLSVLDLGNGVSSAVIGDKRTVNDQTWAPDGRRLAYEAAVNGVLQFFTRVAGSPNEEPLFESPVTPKYLDDWSADGTSLLFHTGDQLFVVPADGSSEPRRLLDSADGIDQARFSPDGAWVAYQIVESNVPQVWVASFPAFDQRQRVSPAGGAQPVWARDGKELFYLTRGGTVMVAKVGRGVAGAIEFTAPVELFQSPLTVPTSVLDQYAVSKDGQRFLFMRPRVATGTKPPITVVVNWAASLEKQ